MERRSLVEGVFSRAASWARRVLAVVCREAVVARRQAMVESAAARDSGVAESVGSCGWGVRGFSMDVWKKRRVSTWMLWYTICLPVFCKVELRGLLHSRRVMAGLPETRPSISLRSCKSFRCLTAAAISKTCLSLQQQDIGNNFDV